MVLHGSYELSLLLSPEASVRGNAAPDHFILGQITLHLAPNLRIGECARDTLPKRPGLLGLGRCDYRGNLRYLSACSGVVLLSIRLFTQEAAAVTPPVRRFRHVELLVVPSLAPSREVLVGVIDTPTSLYGG